MTNKGNWCSQPTRITAKVLPKQPADSSMLKSRPYDPGITAFPVFVRSPQRTAQGYPLGRVLAIVETLLTSSLFALFLLAIRRQFRR
jgi:hypothetical protein